MFTTEIKEAMELTKSSMETVVSSQGKAIFGASAIEAAKSKSHLDFKNGGGFEKGDIIFFPADTDELDSCFGKQGKSVFVLLPITRGAKSLVLPVYSKWLHNDVHPCDDRANIDETQWLGHEGAPADDARTAGMSDYDVFKAFVGKKVLVTKVAKKQCRVIKRGANPDDKGHFPESAFVAGNRKFYTFEYTE